MAVCSTTAFRKDLTRFFKFGQPLHEEAIGTTRGHAKGETLTTSGPYRRPLFKSGKAVRRTRKGVKALETDQTRRPPGRFVEVDGVRVHYIARGKGRPVVLVHGNGTMAEDFVICGLID